MLSKHSRRLCGRSMQDYNGSQVHSHIDVNSGTTLRPLAHTTRRINGRLGLVRPCFALGEFPVPENIFSGRL
jgi:hypothetical protein